MSSIECARLAEHDDFKKRVNYFMKKAAIAVQAEAPSTDNHEDRIEFAGHVLRNSANIHAFALGVCTNGTIADTIEDKSESQANTDIIDSVLEYTVNSMFDAYSG